MEISKILIGIDSSKYADHAAEYGFSLAKKLNASVGLVTIIEPVAGNITPMADTTFGMPLQGTANLGNDSEIFETQNELAKSAIDKTIEKFAEGMQVTTYTDFGSSADGILNCCAQFGADLIVVGNHHRSGFDRLLMGSVASDVIKNAKVPVLVVPFDEEDDE